MSAATSSSETLERLEIGGGDPRILRFEGRGYGIGITRATTAAAAANLPSSPLQDSPSPVDSWLEKGKHGWRACATLGRKKIGPATSEKGRWGGRIDRQRTSESVASPWAQPTFTHDDDDDDDVRRATMPLARNFPLVDPRIDHATPFESCECRTQSDLPLIFLLLSLILFLFCAARAACFNVCRLVPWYFSRYSRRCGTWG